LPGDKQNIYILCPGGFHENMTERFLVHVISNKCECGFFQHTLEWRHSERSIVCNVLSVGMAREGSHGPNTSITN
jgi:hypothetical protein